jgi:hypothetical protein
MGGVESKSMDAPVEVRRPDTTTVEIVSVGGNEVGRFTFQPGWRWSECIVGDEDFVGVEFKSAADYAKS